MISPESHELVDTCLLTGEGIWLIKEISVFESSCSQGPLLDTSAFHADPAVQ